MVARRLGLTVLLAFVALGLTGCGNGGGGNAQRPPMGGGGGLQFVFQYQAPFTPFYFSWNFTTGEISYGLQASVPTIIGTFSIQTQTVLKPGAGYQEGMTPFNAGNGYTNVIIRDAKKGEDTVHRLNTGDDFVCCKAEGTVTFKSAHGVLIIYVSETEKYEVWREPRNGGGRAAREPNENKTPAQQRAADQRAADQRAADQRAADQRAADQRAADAERERKQAAANFDQQIKYKDALDAGNDAHDRKQYFAAINHFRAAKSFAMPNSIEYSSASFNLGVALFWNKQYVEAKRAFDGCPGHPGIPAYLREIKLASGF